MHLDRTMHLVAGEHRIRDAVGWEAPLKFAMEYSFNDMTWYVATKFLREGQPALFLGKEPLDGFPSEMLIAQCMLVC